MTGYQSKRAAAQDKLAQLEQEPMPNKLERLLWEYIDLQAAHPEHKPNHKTWSHLKVYAPLPEQEPVAMLERDPSIGRLRVTYEDAVTELDEGVYPLYTEPQGWRDNVAASKPVAWLEPEWGEKICPEVGYEATITDDHPRDLCWIPLYAQRPWVMQREWVDLTDEEIDKWAHELHGVIYAVMADLKEKNT